jgi:hypothetical protein
MGVAEAVKTAEYGRIVEAGDAKRIISNIPFTNGLGSAFMKAYEMHAGCPVSAVTYRTGCASVDYIIGKCYTDRRIEVTLWGGVVDACFLRIEPRLGIGINFKGNDINFNPNGFRWGSLALWRRKSVRKFPLQARKYGAEIFPFGPWEEAEICCEVKDPRVDDLTKMIAHNIECLRRDK